MPARDWLDSGNHRNLTMAGGSLCVTSGSPVGPVITAVTPAPTITGPVVELGIGNQRIGTATQFVAPGNPTVPNGVSFEMQWSTDNVNWYPCPSSAQGDARLSLITTSGQDRSMVTRGQCLARYMRWKITGGENLPSGGSVYMWYGRIS